MQIQLLFEELVSAIKQKTGIESIFNDSDMLIEKSGMISNRKVILSYGFFPFGTGMLIENIQREDANIEKGGIMVLGNDFGNYEYLKKCIENGKREKASNTTIRNLLSNLTGDIKDTFFTNFYLGVREKGTNTTRFQPLTKSYQRFCYDFFTTQLLLLKPKKVICLGHAVRQALAENTNLFPEWKAKGVSLKKLYAENKNKLEIDDSQFGKITFMVIPHPCDTRNFHSNYLQEI